MDDFSAFARLLDALEPWRAQLVIVGGWAHRLHRYHPRATTPDYQALRTRDADLALSDRAAFKGDIATALVEKDFNTEYLGDDKPPVTHYRLGTEDHGFYAEFLVPLQGSGYTRDGRPDVTKSVAGVTAQKLRHVDLLLERPWTVHLGPDVDAAFGQPVEILVANPVSFLAQKLLIQDERRPAKQAQDALYIHDTLELFGRELEGLRTVWISEIRPTLRKTAVLVERLARERFSEVTDVIRTAARLPQDRTLRPEQMQAAIASGLQEIFERSPR